MGATTWDWVFSMAGYDEYVVVVLDRATDTFLVYEGPGQGALLQADMEIVGEADAHGGFELADFYQLTFNEDGGAVRVRGRS